MYPVTRLNLVRVRRLVAFALPFFLCLFARATDAPEKKSFNLPADSAEKSLKLFSEQSGRGVVFLSTRVKGVRTNPVQGQLTPGEALDRMVQGTGLTASLDEKTGAFAIRQESVDPNAQRAIATNDRPQNPTASNEDKSAAKLPGSDSDSIFTLSPFVVPAGEDTGYKATTTLAGTRLRSDLKDIAASISVVTKDFMNDVNVTDLSSLFVYTLGTEIGGYGGNFSGVGDPTNTNSYSDAVGQLVPSNRIRGLSSADTARDYFASGVPFDSYNVDRVEINRGANAILFGLGSPAGIVNTSIIKADPHKTATKVEAQYGSYHSYRGTLDTNQALVPGKFALRLATMFDETKYRVEDAYNKTRGFTATLTYQPFKETTLRVTHEHGRSDSTKPQIRPPYDWFTWWWAAGKPVWDPTTGTGRLLGTPVAPFTPTTIFAANGIRASGNLGAFYVTGNFGGWRGSEVGLFYQDPNSSRLGGVNIGGGQTVDGVEAFTNNVIPNPLSPATLTTGGMLGINDGATFIKQVYHATSPFESLYTQQPQITDPRIFDYYHHMMGGPSQYEWGEWTNTNVSLEQTFFDRKAGIEIAYQKESVDRGYVAPSDYQLDLDINEKLPNGVANPNFLRPVMANFGLKSVGSADNEAYRATGYYRLDFRRTGPAWLGRIFGRHDLQANYMAQESFNESLSGQPYANNYDYVSSAAIYNLPANMGSNSRIVSLVNYLGPSVLNTASPAEAHVQGLTVAQDPSGLQSMKVLYHPNPPTTTVTPTNTLWQTGTFGLITNERESIGNTVSGASRSDLQVHSLSSAIQSYWFDSNLVSTVGWRTDRVWSFSTGTAVNTPLGTKDIRPDVFYPVLNRSAKDSSTTWGIVGHLPRFVQKYLPWDTQLSAFYNHSDNFRVAAVRYTITGEGLPSETGTTREYGISATTFGGKLDFKVAHYESVAGNATVSSLGGSLNQLALMAGSVIDRNYRGDNVGNAPGIAAFQGWLASPVGQVYTKAFQYVLTPNANGNGLTPPAAYGNYSSWSNNPTQISAVSALKSTGLEFETTFNPTRHWRLTANASRAEAVRTQIAPELYNFMFGAGGLVPLIQNPDGSASAAGSLIGSPTSNVLVQSFHDFVYTNILNNGLVTTFAQEGTASSELRKWNWRLVTNYEFDESPFGRWLNGVGVGGAVRWQDRGLIGYGGGRIVSGGNTLIVSDVSKPYYGPAERVFDLWLSYRRNLGHGIRWRAQLNIKNVGVGNSLIPLQADPDGNVVMWRIKEPQKWTFSNVFEF